MFRVLITDSSYKHAIALARYLKEAVPDIDLAGHTMATFNIGSWYSCFDRSIRGVPLEQVVQNNSFDMVIPVGGRSVLHVSKLCPELAILPSPDRLEICFDKVKTIEFAGGIGIPVPRSQVLFSLDDLVEKELTLPCVLKPSREATALTSVSYCNTVEEVRRKAVPMLETLKNDTAGLLVQEFIPGGGCGFFALMDDGKPLRVFMHQRIREYPPTGGPSTAARALYSPRLKELGLSLLSSLRWRGVAMVEFKDDSRTGDFVLMEINAKFWGSLELGLRAGVNFGADLVRLFRGERLSYCESYDRECRFYWPLDDDLRTLLETRSLGKIRDYWQSGASTNLGQSTRADLCKVAYLLKQLVLGR